MESEQNKKNESATFRNLQNDIPILKQDFSGQKFGRYRLIKEIGRGGMGCVYKAMDLKLNRTVALKVLISSGSDHQEKKRFLREARTMAKLRHLCIVPIHDMGDEQGLPFFTMDLIEGVNLKELTKISKLTSRQIVNIMIKVGKAISYAGMENIVLTNK